MELLKTVNLQSYPLLGGFSLQNINLTIPKNKRIGLIGQTGSGKSTLLKIIAGLLQHQSGEIYFNGEKQLGPNFQLIAGIKGIGYLSQHFELRNNYRMEELFSYANVHFAKDEVEKLFKVCNVTHLQKRKSTELSGGEKQRVALVRLLLTQPQLLLLDEPFSNLDNIHTNELKKVIEKVSGAYNITCLICSHNANDVLPWADELLVLEKGIVVQQGSTANVFQNPINETCAGLLGDFSILTENLQQLFTTTKTFVRPNNFVIENNGKHESKILACEYFGSYFKLLVEFNNEKLIFYSTSSYQKSESIFFSFIK